MKYSKGIFLKNKVNPLSNNDPDAHTNDVIQAFIKLANDREFFNELKELFPSKIAPKSENKQWRPMVLNQRRSPGKDKPKLLRKNEIKGIDNSRMFLFLYSINKSN